MKEIRVKIGADTSELEQGLANAEQGMGGLKRVADKTARGLSSFGDSATKLGKNLSIVSAGIGTVTVAAFALVKGTADAGRELQLLAQVSNTSTREFQRLAAGAATVGIEQDKLADIFKDVNDRVGDFMSTGGGPMADFFENIAPKVGVTADQFARLSGPEALQLYVSSLEKAGVSQQEMTFYMEAMASDATALVPLLRDGGAEMQRFGDAAEQAGAIMDESAIAASNEFSVALSQLMGAFTGLKDRFATTLMPVMAQFMQLITDKVVPAADIAIAKFGEFMSFIQGLPGPVVDAIGMIGAALGVGGPIVLGIGIVSTALGKLVAASGPVGLLITAASLLVAAWQIWGDDIKAIIGQAVEYITGAFTSAVDAVKGFGTNTMEAITGALTFVRDQFNMFLGFVRGIPEQLLLIGQQMIQGLLDGIMLKWEELKAKIYELGGMLPQWMREMLDIQSPSRVFHEIGSFIGEGLANGISDAQGMVAQATQTLGDAAVTSAQGTVSGILGAMQQLFQGSKPLAVAMALINTWQGMTEALKLPFPKNLIAAAQTLATGMNAVKNIKSTTPSGGGAASSAGGASSARSAGASAASSAAAATPQMTANYTITGDVIGKQTGGELIKSINEAIRSGYRINLEWA